MRHFFIAFVLFLAALGCYSNSLHNGFMLDDHTYFDDTMKSLKFVPYHFLLSNQSVFGFHKHSNRGYYRPLARVLYTVLYVAFQEDRRPYHIANIFFLATGGFLIYLILYSFFEARAGAFCAGLFFTVHPLNSTFIDFFGSGIYLAQAALILLCLWCVAQEKTIWRWWSLVFYFLSVFAHEYAMILPLYATVMMLALGGPVWRRVWPLWLASVLYFIFSLYCTSLMDNLLSNSPVKGEHRLGLFEYLSTSGKVAFWYIERLLIPDRVVFLWGTPLIQSTAWSGFLLGLIAGSVAAFVWLWKNKHKVMCFGSGLIMVSLLPGLAGGISRPSMICIEPHWVIFALIGFCICLGDLISRITKRIYAFMLAALIATSWFVLDRQYNVLWSNEEGYCYYWHKVFPTSQVPVYYMATAYQQEGNIVESQRLFIEAFQSPHYKESLDYKQMMAISEVKQRHYDEARRDLEELLSVQPDNAYLLTYLGVVDLLQNKKEDAKKQFEHAVYANQFEVPGRLDLASIYTGEGNIQGAIRLYREILDFDPNNEIALVELIKIYLQQGDRDNILKMARRLAKHSHDPVILHNVDLIFQRYGK